MHGCFMVGFPGETRATMEKTLELAIRLNPDSAQFYPVMPYPGTGAYQWAKDNGYLATEDFEDWLTTAGGHRCVLNLPGLRPGELEGFCESAVRRFHFRPTYALRKLRQAVTHPREGLRSLHAGWNFLSYLLRNDRHLQVPFRAQRREVTEGWSSEVAVPKGRMERIENLVRLRKGGSHEDFLSSELVEGESAAHRP